MFWIHLAAGTVGFSGTPDEAGNKKGGHQQIGGVVKFGTVVVWVAKMICLPSFISLWTNQSRMRDLVCWKEEYMGGLYLYISLFVLHTWKWIVYSKRQPAMRCRLQENLLHSRISALRNKRKSTKMRDILLEISKTICQQNKNISLAKIPQRTHKYLKTSAATLKTSTFV